MFWMNFLSAPRTKTTNYVFLNSALYIRFVELYCSVVLCKSRLEICFPDIPVMEKKSLEYFCFSIIKRIAHLTSFSILKATPQSIFSPPDIFHRHRYILCWISSSTQDIQIMIIIFLNILILHQSLIVQKQLSVDVRTIFSLKDNNFLV